jgi:NADH-quinone oxidoreductase subunit F
VLSTIRHFRDEYEAAHPRQALRGGRLPVAGARALPERLPGGRGRAGLRLAGRREALRRGAALHRERNPFAAVCARVCFHTCEDKCRRASLDEPVSIRGIKRFMVDQEVTIQLPEVRENAANAARKIAIVGAGPAGLSCAYFLARWATSRRSSRPSRGPAACWCRPFPPTACRAKTLAREIRMIDRMGVEIPIEIVTEERQGQRCQVRRDVAWRVRSRAAGAGLRRATIQSSRSPADQVIFGHRSDGWIAELLGNGEMR